MAKFSITCSDFRQVRRNTLRGFVSVTVDELKLTVHDVALHEKGDARWASLPAKPQIKDGGLVKDAATGKIAYVPVLEFTDRTVRDAFSRAVIDAVLRRERNAFAAGEVEVVL
jgi:hypothetical protein